MTALSYLQDMTGKNDLIVSQLTTALPASDASTRSYLKNGILPPDENGGGNHGPDRRTVERDRPADFSTAATSGRKRTTTSG